MPKGKKFGGKDFVPGHSQPGPGRPKLIPELKGEPRLDRDSYNRILNKLIYKSQAELKEVLSDPKQPMIFKIVASIVAKAATNGDYMRLEALLNRAIGPVPKEISGVAGGPIMNINLTTEEAKKIAARLATKEEIPAIDVPRDSEHHSAKALPEEAGD